MEGFLNNIFKIISFFAKPLVVICLSIPTIISLILGAIANPAGAINGIICRVIDIILIPWPSTPESMKLGSLLSSFANSFPIVGYGIVLDIAQTLAGMGALFVIIKIYKLIPFKAS